MRLIVHRGRVATLASERVYFASPIEVLESDHPERRFVSALCPYSHVVDTGRAGRQRYEAGQAERFARALLIPDDALAAITDRPDVSSAPLRDSSVGISQRREGTITMSQTIRLGDHGEHVRVYQGHLNDRLHAHGASQVEVSGTCTAHTIDRSAFAAWFLGALSTTVKAVQNGTISPGVQAIIADPDSREEAQRQRAKQRRGQPFPGSNGSSGDFRIVTCSEWGAVAATGQITRVGRPSKIIFHHTDGHHPELDHQPGDTLEEAMAFARAIQRDHMHRNPAFIDSGHNFLVTRSGHILEGRHGSLAAIKDGVMVQSAHCIGQNTHPGIEHEHVNPEGMTPIQREASLFLHEFICRHTGIDPSAIHGHGEFNATECPGALKPGLTAFRQELAQRLEH